METLRLSPGAPFIPKGDPLGGLIVLRPPVNPIKKSKRDGLERPIYLAEAIKRTPKVCQWASGAEATTRGVGGNRLSRVVVKNGKTIHLLGAVLPGQPTKGIQADSDQSQFSFRLCFWSLI